MTFLPDNYSLPKYQKPERLWYCKEHCQGVNPFQLAGGNGLCEIDGCHNYRYGRYENGKAYIPIYTMK